MSQPLRIVYDRDLIPGSKPYWNYTYGPVFRVPARSVTRIDMSMHFAVGGTIRPDRTLITLSSVSS